jgi:hypothetical protein
MNEIGIQQQRNGTGSGKRKYSNKNLRYCQFFHDKNHTD